MVLRKQYSIKLDLTVKQHLDKRKIHKRESYNEVIQKLLSATGRERVGGRVWISFYSCRQPHFFLGWNRLRRPISRKEIKNQHLAPTDIAILAEKVKVMYLEEHMSDSEIAVQLNAHPSAVFQIRKLLGLAWLRTGDITVDIRRIEFDSVKDSWKMPSFCIDQISEDLGLDEKKCWGFKVGKVSKNPKCFNILIEEITAKTRLKFERKKKDFEDEDDDDKK